MTNIWNSILKKIDRLTNMKNSSGCNNNCPYYEMHREDYHFYKKDIKESIAKLIKENEKYFINEIERTTFDCICDSSNLKTIGYSHKIAYEVFKKYGIYMYVNDLTTYINSPRSVKYELQRLIDRYGIERVTEEIAAYLKDNYPQRFGINIVCKQ